MLMCEKKMNHLCAISDYNFLPKGLTLYDSLREKSSDFIMHYLCFDKKSFDKMSEYGSDTLIVYHDEEFLSNKILKNLKIKDRKYYSYTLASFFSNYLIEKIGSDITYIDSDIYFHQDIDLIFKEIKSRDIGMFRHRQYSMDFPNANGWFNVGVVHFKNTDIGRHVLNWWADAVLNRKYPELATCGDQRYLDAFLEIDRDSVFIDGAIGHGAPWQWQLYSFDTYEKDGCITWNNDKQKLVFSHFSQFEYSIKKNTYTPSTMHHCYTPVNFYTNGVLKSIYDNYFDEIKKTHIKYDIEESV